MRKPNPVYAPDALWNFAYDWDLISGKLSNKTTGGLTKSDSSFGIGQVVSGTDNLNRYVLNCNKDANVIGSNNFACAVTFTLNEVNDSYSIVGEWAGNTNNTLNNWFVGGWINFDLASFFVAVGATRFDVAVNVTWIAGHTYTLIANRNGTTISINWFEHESKTHLSASLTDAGITTVNSTVQNLTLGEINSNSASNANISVYNAALFKRALSDFEIKTLLINHGKLFKPRQKSLSVNPQIPAIGGLNPTPGHIYITQPLVNVNQAVSLTVTPGHILLTMASPWVINQNAPPVVIAQTASSNLRIVNFNEIDTCTLSADLSAGNLVAANLQSDVKSLVWRSTNKTGVLTATWADWKTISMVAFPFSNFSNSATIKVQCFLNSTDPFPALDTGNVLAARFTSNSVFGWDKAPPGVANFGYGGMVYAVVWFAPAACKKMIVTINDSLNTQSYIEAGRMVAGEYWSPVNNADYGLQVNWKDASKSIRNDAGDLITDIMPRAKMIQLELGMLDVADRSKIMKQLRQNGLSRPVFVSVFPENSDVDKSQDYMIYGKLSQLDSVKMPNFAYYSSGLTIEEV
jgi:hypothetical protein